MAAPVIAAPVSLLLIERGVPFTLALSAPGADAWAVQSGALPAGLLLDTETGDISGSPTIAGEGVWLSGIIAADAETPPNWSDPILLTWGVLSTDAGIRTSDGLEIEIEWNILTRRVRVLGIPADFDFGPPAAAAIPDAEAAPGAPAIFAVKDGMRRPAHIRLVREDGGPAQDIDLTTLSLTLAEFAPERKIALDEGAFEKVGTGVDTRYVTMLYVSPAVWQSILSNYEEDDGTFLDALAEIQLTLVNQFAFDESATETFTLTGSQTETVALDCLLPEIESAEYDIALALRIPDHPAQNIDFATRIAVAFDGSDFSFTEYATGYDNDPATGDAEPHHWQASAAMLSYVAGETEGAPHLAITAQMETAAAPLSIIVDLATIAAQYQGSPFGDYLRVESGFFRTNESGYGGDFLSVRLGDPIIGFSATISWEDGFSAADLLAATNATLLYPDCLSAVVFDETAQTITLVIDPLAVDPPTLLEDETHPASTFTSSTVGASYTGATLDLAVSIVGSQYSAPQQIHSETFRLRIERDLHPD